MMSFHHSPFFGTAGDRGMLTKRQKNILRILLNKEGSYCTGNEISEKTAVSLKTVQHEIKVLRNELNGIKAELISIPNRGYQLICEDASEREKIEGMLTEKRSQSDENDYALMIIKLLVERNGYIRSHELADMLYISESKLNKDLRGVKEVLEEYHLSLPHRPHHGICIQGEESDIRRLILSNGLLSVHEFTDDEERVLVMNKLTEIVAEVLSEQSYLISDVALENLIMNIYLAMQRIKKGCVIDFSEENIQLLQTRAIDLAERICEKSEEFFHQELPVPERMYMALYLQSETHDDSTQVVTEEVETIISGMLEEIRKKVGFDFSSDLDLHMSLAMHLKPMMMRVRNHFQLKNPIMDEILKSYPLAYDITLVAAEYMYENYDIRVSADELSYLSTYFVLAMERKSELKEKKKVLIISSQRRGNTMIMKKMIMSRFEKRIDSIDIINILDLDRTDLNQYDVVLSSITEYDRLPDKYPQISQFISPKDYRIIENALNSSSSGRRFEDFFDSRNVLLNIPVKNKEELLDLLVDTAVSTYPNLNRTELLASINKREEAGFTYFDQGIAVPHPDRMLENEESFVITALLDHQIEWQKGENVSLVFLFCIKNNDTENLQEFYRGVSVIISDESLFNELRKTKTFESFYRVIRRIGGMNDRK